jgi:hypothetical protein
MIQHRPFERRAGRQAFNLVGKSRLKIAVVCGDRRAND